MFQLTFSVLYGIWAQVSVQIVGCVCVHSVLMGSFEMLYFDILSQEVERVFMFIHLHENMATDPSFWSIFLHLQ